MISPQKARAMRQRIEACGLNFRDVYQEVGIERETDTTPEQLAEVNRIIKERGGPTEIPITAVDAAADKAMRTIESSLAACGAGVRHMLVLIDAVDVPDGEGNATLAGFGYGDPRDLLAELLTHAEEVGGKLGITVNVIVPQARNQG